MITATGSVISLAGFGLSFFSFGGKLFCKYFEVCHLFSFSHLMIIQKSILRTYIHIIVTFTIIQWSGDHFINYYNYVATEVDISLLT